MFEGGLLRSSNSGVADRCNSHLPRKNSRRRRLEKIACASRACWHKTTERSTWVPKQTPAWLRWLRRTGHLRLDALGLTPEQTMTDAQPCSVVFPQQTHFHSLAVVYSRRASRASRCLAGTSWRICPSAVWICSLMEGGNLLDGHDQRVKSQMYPLM